VASCEKERSVTTHLRPAACLLVLLSALTGLAYPFAVTGAAQALFPAQANGSLLVVVGRTLGSRWLGQPFSEPRFFWSRPSATARVPYDAAASAGSNLGPSHPALRDAVRARIATLRAAGAPSGPVPIDLVTTSGSGLDPDITPAAAYYQVSRVARARGLPEDDVRRLVDAHVEGRTFGLLGEPRVNVLRLNLALESGAR
jgi:K+-transporting ATPase ATPase C chain